MKIIALRALGRGFTATSGFLTGLALAGCGLFGPSAEQFLIRVDSIAVPKILAAGDTLTAHFYGGIGPDGCWRLARVDKERSEEHTSELQSRGHLVCRLLLEKKKNRKSDFIKSEQRSNYETKLHL